jgi:hypothetical protein
VHAAACATNTVYLLPMKQSTPARPDARVEVLCNGIRRLAAFQPDVVLSCTGPAGDLSSERARSIVVEACAALGVRSRAFSSPPTAIRRARRAIG